jgi:hypothetical protein
MLSDAVESLKKLPFSLYDKFDSNKLSAIY